MRRKAILNIGRIGVGDADADVDGDIGDTGHQR
jgi:hypothetical protein